MNFEKTSVFWNVRDQKTFEKEMNDRVLKQKEQFPQQDWSWLPDFPISLKQVSFLWNEEVSFSQPRMDKYFSISTIAYPEEITQQSIWLLTIVDDYMKHLLCTGMMLIIITIFIRLLEH